VEVLAKVIEEDAAAELEPVPGGPTSSLHGGEYLMLLTVRQSYELLANHGSYVREICNKCGKGIGPLCFTRRDQRGVWCSRECRDGKEARTPGTCTLPSS
jgi:hypothetical protein